MAPKKPAPPNAVYQLKITLRGIRPPIWRRVLVGDTVTLHHLHRVIQAAMGWEDTRLHRFTINSELYGEPSTEGFYRVKDERKSTLGEAAPSVKTKFRYEYDLSDEWDHEVEVEEILPVTPDQPLPQAAWAQNAQHDSTLCTHLRCHRPTAVRDGCCRPGGNPGAGLANTGPAPSPGVGSGR